MFNKKLKAELKQYQSNLGAAIDQVGQVTGNREFWHQEADQYLQLYSEKQREANEKATQLLNFIWGLAKHEATLQCVKPNYMGSGYSYVVSFKPHLHVPGNAYQSLELDEKTLNLVTNLMDSIGIKGWAWLKPTAYLAKSYNSESVTNAPADIETAEAELQALLDEAVRVNRMRAAFEPRKIEKEKG